MERQEVNSSNIASIGYDPETSVLEIEFRGSGIYEYYDIPRDVHEKFARAPSHGRYFDQYIKDLYKFSKIG